MPGRIHCANTELNTVHVEDVFQLTNGNRYTLMIGAESKAPIIRSGNTGKIWAINWEQLIQMARDAGVDADGGDLTRRCERCRFRWLDRKRTHDERVDFASVCGHPDAAGDHGHATRESATCNHWEL